MILLSHERIIFVSPTLKNLSCCQVPDKNGRVKSSAVQNRAKKAEKKQAAVGKKKKLIVKVGGLQLEMPYHVLKLCSIRGKCPKKAAYVCHRLFRGKKKKKKKKKRCIVQYRVVKVI